MDKRRICIFGAVCLVLLMLLFVPSNPGRLVAQVFPSVKVVNTPAECVPVCEVAEPFQQQLQIVIPAGQSTGSASFEVPDGRRLVIEFVSAHIALPPGSSPRFSLRVTTNGITANHFLAPVMTQPGGGTGVSHAVISQSVKLYADGGTRAFFIEETGTIRPTYRDYMATLAGRTMPPF